MSAERDDSRRLAHFGDVPAATASDRCQPCGLRAWLPSAPLAPESSAQSRARPVELLQLHCRFGTIGCTEFRAGVRQMARDGVLTQAETLGDVPVRQSGPREL